MARHGLDGFCGGDLWASSFPDGLPNVSICMQHTLLVWVPSAFFLLLFPILVIQAQRTSHKFAPLPFNFFFIFKMVLTLFITLDSVFVLFYVAFNGKDRPNADLLYPILWVLVWAPMTISHYLRLRGGMVTSGIMHITSFIFMICGAPEFYQWIRMSIDNSPGQDNHLSISYYIWYSFVVLHTFLMCWADTRLKKGEDDGRSPELDSSFLNRLTLWWYNPIPWLGARKDLEIEDIFELNEGSTTPYLSQLWESYWNPRVDDYWNRKSIWNKEPTDQEPQLPSVVGCLFRMFKWEFLTASLLKSMSDTLQFANPFLLHQLIDFVSDTNSPLWVGIAYAILMFGCSELRSLLLNSYFYIMFRMGIKFQTVLTAAVYKKTLRLSNSARRDKTVGEIINLMAIDVERFQMITPQIQQFWSCPYQIIFALTYLYITLGYSALPGIVIMIIFLPMNIFSSVLVKKWQVQQMVLKDERTKMVNEVLNGIKVVKLYAWEIPMEEHIENIRNKELALIWKASIVRNIIDSFNTASPFMVALFSFGTYTLSSPSHELTPQIAFVSLALFNQLRSPMTMIALLISQTVQAIVSNKRLKEFFVADELDPNVVDRSEQKERSRDAVEMHDFSATWEEGESRQTTLQNIEMTVPRQSLYAVVGKVGSGKSSLLAALLGEMGKLRGRLGVRGRLAYVPQQTWIQNMTVRDNILFGKPFDRKLYNQVIYACALRSDLKILPHGDLTEIGEKGINLSGGQKARVALARAVYQNYDVYLLDDPLSAVDAHVGRHIYEKVVGPNGMLKSKTRILVTHGLSFTKNADEIIVLEDGKIAETGTYNGLMGRKGAFYRFVEEYKSSKEKQEEADTDSTSEEETKEGYTEDDYIDKALELKEIEFKALTSQISTLSVSPSQKETSDETEERKLIKKEGIESGGVKLSVYSQYVKAASILMSLLFCVGLTAFMVFQVMRSFWLSAWSDEYDSSKPNATKMALGWRLGIYGALGVTESLCFLAGLMVLVVAGLRASTNLHAPLIHNLLRSPMAFFDTTPLGRILNRCSKDIEAVDMLLPLNFRYLVMCFLQVFTTLVVIVISTPLFGVVIIPLTIIYLAFLRFYVPTSRQLKRLESINRSPIYSHFGETIQGAASIRAFDKVAEFENHSGFIVDRFIRCRYSNIISNRWLGIRLEFVGNCIIFFAALFAALSKEFGWSTSPGVVGVSISYALNITEVLNFAVRQVSEIEANIVAVERINEYTHTPNEAPWEVPAKKPPKNWPSHGVVNFIGYSTRYREGLDLVLHRIFADFRQGEKVGIVGRTGAGKSSFTLALFRMIEAAEGQILIDGIDIANLGLHDLRGALTIIPQEPVLFSGSLRFNLDPFSKSSDADIWTALELAHLKAFANTLGGLESTISEGGENISVGQRQLVCLARALLRRSRVLILDEATAAVDVSTDTLIQATIREQFKDCTVLTIAHRLNTILDYDRIMVLDKGKIVELDSPDNLIADRNSAFAKMLADSKSEEKS